MGCVSKMKALALIASVALLAIFLGLAPQRATAQDLDEASRLNQRALELYEKGRLGLQVPRRELQHQHSLLILLMPSAYGASLPGDSANGKRLYDANCMGCHDTSVFTRKDRAVQSLDALKEQLISCSHMANADFSASEMQDLLKYLNDQFYEFR
jgi:hypothetical protein